MPSCTAIIYLHICNKILSTQPVNSVLKLFLLTPNNIKLHARHLFTYIWPADYAWHFPSVMIYIWSLACAVQAHVFSTIPTCCIDAFSLLHFCKDVDVELFGIMRHLCTLFGTKFNISRDLKLGIFLFTLFLKKYNTPFYFNIFYL